MLGESGAKLNQALASGEFKDFLDFTREFGVKTGKEASQSAAQFQSALSALSVVFNGTFMNVIMYILAWLSFMPLFWLSGRLGSLAWDDYTYLRKFVIRQRMKKSTRQNLRALLNNIREELPKI